MVLVERLGLHRQPLKLETVQPLFSAPLLLLEAVGPLDLMWLLRFVMVGMEALEVEVALTFPHIQMGLSARAIPRLYPHHKATAADWPDRISRVAVAAARVLLAALVRRDHAQEALEEAAQHRRFLVGLSLTQAAVVVMVKMRVEQQVQEVGVLGTHTLPETVLLVL